MHLSLIFRISLVIIIIGGLCANPYTIQELLIESGLWNEELGDPLYLTEYIENGNIETARNLSMVSHPEISIESYAGYFTVNKEYNSNLFFWFFPAKENPNDAPVLLWLQGGPGDSSLLGLFLENGPFSIDSNEKLIPREYSWHLNHNIIYIDNPVGTGFSFTLFDEGYAKNQNDVGQNLLRAMQQFFLLFPHLQKNEFFISGESYAGKFVPALGYAIYQDSKRQTDQPDGNPKMPKINLKGLAIGNGFSDPLHQSNYADYLYNLGLIDSNGRQSFIRYQNQGIDCIKKRDFECAFEIFDDLLHKPNSLIKNLTGFKWNYNFLKTEPYNIAPLFNFVEDAVTRRAIHVSNNIFHGAINVVEIHLKLDFMDSVANWVAELLSYYPILIYNGQLDIIVAYPLTINYLEHLNFTGAEQYKNATRNIWRVDNEVAGYVKQGGNLTEVLMRNAGHMAPADQPKFAFDMISRFTHHRGFQ